MEEAAAAAGKKGDDDVSMMKSEPILVQPEIKNHHRFYFLSNLDQVLPYFTETVYLYKPNDNDKEGSETHGDIIEQSLAKILVYYYPFAGRLRVDSKGKVIVECTDDGVPFVEAIAECNMDVVDVKVPNSTMLKKLVCTSSGLENILEMPLLTVQVTRFRCGGLALGLSISHIIADGLSSMDFINSWSEIARGIPLSVNPVLDRSIFRARQPPTIDFPFDLHNEITDVSNISTLYQEEQLLSKCFLFDFSDKLARLKNMAMEDGTIKSCTNFTALTALVWRARSKALNMKPDQKTKLLFVVDARSKLNPPLPRKGYFGNGILVTGCVCNAGELIEKPLSFAVNAVQKAVEMVNEDFIRSWIDYFEEKGERFSLVATLVVSSWTGLSLYNADFGWGNPAEMGCATLTKDAAFFLPDGKEKKGIRLVLCLPNSAMKTFEEELVLVQV